MRFQELHMRPFGTFDDFRLEFGSEAGLHLIYGPNGAGKSTTLTALRSVLYGMSAEHRVHASANLRIGATLLGEDGRTLKYVRRTKRSAPLWNATDDEPIAEELLTPFLGNVSESDFKALFGLDWEGLVTGGKELMKGEGDTGRALFGAMLGGERLSQIERRLSDEVGVTRSTKSDFARLLAEWKALSSKQKSAQLSANAYGKDRTALKRKVEEVAVLVEQRRQLQRKRDQLTQLAQAQRTLALLDEKTAERKTHGDLQPMGDADARRIQRLVAEENTLRERQEERTLGLQALGTQTATAEGQRSDSVLEASSDIDDLAQRRTAFKDSLVACSEIAVQLGEARAADQGPGPDAESHGGAESPPLNDLDELGATIELLSNATREAESNRDTALRDLHRVEAARDEANDRLASVDEAVAEALSVDIDDVRPLPSNLAELRAIALPPTEALEQREEEEAAEAETQRALQQEIDAQAEVSSKATLSLEQLGSGEPPPSLEELRSARDERDRRIESFLAGDTPSPKNAITVQRAISDADRLADLRTDGLDLALQREAETSRRTAAEQRGQALREELVAAREGAAESLARWHALWAKCNIEPLNAQAMLAATERRRAILQRAADQKKAAQEQARSLATEVSQQRAALATAEQLLTEAQAAWTRWATESGFDPKAGAGAARRRIQGVIERNAARRDVTRLEAELKKHEAVVGSFRDTARDLCQRTGVAPAEWNQVPPEVAAGLGAESPGALGLTRMVGLQNALQSSRHADRELVRLKEQTATEEAESKNAALRLAEIGDALAEAQSKTKTESREALSRLAELSSTVRALDADIQRSQAELIDHSGGKAAHELREELGERSPDELQSELQLAREEEEALEQSMAQLRLDEGELRARVEADGSGESARLRAQLAEIESALDAQIASVVRARLAQQLLSQEVERNRRENQGPILERAQGLFETLTLGAYERVHPIDGPGGKPIMVARRPSGQEVRIEQMSSGTCDQLYLALRIASVEHMLKTAAPMPFIADDLFVNFDDARTQAALIVLAELSKSTQVIVFSHHESVVETARQLNGNGVAVDVINLQDEQSREAKRERVP